MHGDTGLKSSELGRRGAGSVEYLGIGSAALLWLVFEKQGRSSE